MHGLVEHEPAPSPGLRILPPGRLRRHERSFRLAPVLLMAAAACSAEPDPALPGDAEVGTPLPDAGERPPDEGRAAPRDSSAVIPPDGGATDVPRPDVRDSQVSIPPEAGAVDASRADVAAGAPACPPGTNLLACDTLRPLPRTLRETGLFPSAPDFGPVPAPMRRFRPRWELWSDGLDKERFVVLPRTPAGRAVPIDISNRETWAFPVGTLFVKTFFADARPGGVRRPVETRIIRRVNDPDPYEQYKYDVYRWNDAGTDGELLDITNPTPVDVTAGGRPLRHQIPSRMQCTKCHAENGTVVIGFDETRLNWAESPASPNQLSSLAAEGFFDRALPANPQSVTDPSPLLGRIKGFVFGNCVHCHGGRNPQLVNLRPAVFVQNTVGKMTMGSGTATGLRVDPGRPENSILWLQLAHMRPRPDINPMPPVGVQIPSADAVKDVGDWIRSLPPLPRL